jgi:leader peptidase (prepilin peptidase)/N-methyltransferase
VKLAPASKILFTETALVLPDGTIPYDEIFYRKTDVIKLDAATVELCDRCYWNVPVEIALVSSLLRIGEEELKPEDVPHMEVTTDRLEVPREALGLGDVKFMAAIGAFLGWQAVIFSLGVSSFIGAAVALPLMALKKHERSSRIPYGPYLALAAVIWVFGGYRWWHYLTHPH